MVGIGKWKTTKSLRVVEKEGTEGSSQGGFFYVVVEQAGIIGRQGAENSYLFSPIPVARSLFFLPVRLPLRFSREVIDKSPSPASENVTCANHVLVIHSGLPYTPAHDPVWFVTLHDGGEISVSYRF